MLGMPLALGSWWGLCVLLLMMFTVLWRLFNEEHLLKKELPGYSEYTQKVPIDSCLISGKWLVEGKR